jgi:hypothetical protein
LSVSTSVAMDLTPKESNARGITFNWSSGPLPSQLKLNS